MLTPDQALKYRDMIVHALEKEAISIEDGRSMPAEMSSWLLNVSSLASVVIWKSPLWKASQRGNDVFIDRPYPAMVAFNACQIWLFDDPTIVEPACPNPPDDGSLLGILAFESPYYIFQAEIYQDSGGWITVVTGPAQQVGKPCHPQHARVLSGSEFLKMEFVGKERHVFPRHIRRSAELKRRPSLPEINTITLRKTARNDRSDGNPSEPKDWSCSWLVSGHWRNQWYPSTAEWKPRYIAPYVKGDLDKPLREPHGSVYVVSR